MYIPYIRKSNYERHGHKIAELKKTIQGMFFHLRFLYRFRPTHAKRVNTFYFVFDPNFKHPGLADRLKAIIYCYYIAKQSGYEFKIVYSTPYKLSEYLTNNKICWEANEEDLEYSITDTRFFIYTARRTGIDYKLPKGYQYHCYCYKGDDLFYQTGHSYGVHFEELYKELFHPSQYLQNAIDAIGLSPKTYNSVHIRFVNALDSFEQSKYPTLSEERQKDLIKRCHTALLAIAKNSQLPVYVFSDSKRFLDSLTGLPVYSIDNSSIAHISHTANKQTILKTFVDWYLLANSHNVYRLLSEETYKTNFSVYAALIGGNKATDIQI
jgi:hypothetical protein